MLDAVELLDRAIDRIGKYGFTPDYFCHPDGGQCCYVGAINRAAGRASDAPRTPDRIPMNVREALWAVDEAARRETVADDMEFDDEELELQSGQVAEHVAHEQRGEANRTSRCGEDTQTRLNAMALGTLHVAREIAMANALMEEAAGLSSEDRQLAEVTA